MDDIIQLLNVFAPVFSLRVWPSARLLLIGALLTPSARTVASVLRTMGRAAEADFTTYHRVLNRAVWSARCASRILLGVLIETFVPAEGPVVLGGDDTLERRGGRRIPGVGCYRDGVLANRKNAPRNRHPLPDHRVVPKGGPNLLRLFVCRTTAPVEAEN